MSCSTKFKVGDKVRIKSLYKTRRCDYVNKMMEDTHKNGSICTVSEQKSTKINCICINHPSWSIDFVFHVNDLELVATQQTKEETMPKFKVGDKVRLKSYTATNNRYRGNSDSTTQQFKKAIKDKVACEIIGNGRETAYRLSSPVFAESLWVDVDDLELVATQQTKEETMTKFKVGDEVRLKSLDATRSRWEANADVLESTLVSNTVCEVYAVDQDSISIQSPKYTLGSVWVDVADLELVATQQITEKGTQNMSKKISKSEKKNLRLRRRVIVEINGKLKTCKSMDAAQRYATNKGNRATLKSKRFDCRIYDVAKTVTPVDLVQVNDISPTR